MPAQINHPDFLFTNKPCGISTHRPSEAHQGFVEWWETCLQQSLKVCHRLDKETSGALVFACSKEAAAGLTELFQTHQVEKEYYFVSDKDSRYENWVVFEEKAKGTLVVECPWQEGSIGSIETFTEFQKIRSENSLYLYRAKPRTGKTHQIRKHAVHSETPILGDALYGGKSFPRLMLHSKKLKFQWRGENFEFETPLPELFEDLSLLKNQQLCGWMVSLERRKLLFPDLYQTTEALRLFHQETGDLRGDQVGPVWVLGWWNKEKPTSKEISTLSKLMEKENQKNWVFQWRPGVEDQNSAAMVEGFPPESSWEFSEKGVKYLASLERGQNFGLFLDQRERRQWVKENSKDKSLLNLFAFTCGFSVNAALGGATKVVSVDLYKKYLEWGKENFELNGLDPEDSKYEWRAIDSREYLKFAQRKGLKFDLIVCDPPSFSRDKKKGVFRVEKDHGDLLSACWEILSLGGHLLFSTNYEKWDLKEWRERLASLISGFKGAQIEISPSQWDYEWQNRDANLKAFFVKKA